MPLYQVPPADPRTVRRTSGLGRSLTRGPESNSHLPSDLILRQRGVRFESFNPFPIIKAGEDIRTGRGDFVIVKTRGREITTVDVGAPSRLVVGVATAELGRQAVAQSNEETASSVTAPNVITQTPLSQEQIAPGEIEVVSTNTQGVAIVQEPESSYAVTDPAVAAAQQAAANALLDQQLTAESAARQQNAVLTNPTTGQTYNSPSQSLIQQGSTPGSGGTAPTNTKTGGGLQQQAQSLPPQYGDDYIEYLLQGGQ